MMRVTPILTLAAALAAGCAGPGRGGEEPSTPPLREEATMPTVQLTPAEPSAAAGEEHAAAAQASSGGVTVRGTVAAPTPCHRLSADVASQSGGIVLRIAVAADPEAMCAQVIASLGYTAVIGGLPPGRHRLRVVHGYPDFGWDEHTALDITITVP